MNNTPPLPTPLSRNQGVSLETPPCGDGAGVTLV